MLWRNIGFLALCGVLAESKSAIRLVKKKFPDWFIFGASTASYQVEGAWDQDGKADSIWDHLTHRDPCAIKDCSNGDVAADSYNNHERDVEMMRELGLDFYKFSLSWPRLMPSSFPDMMSQEAVNYYDNLINKMIKYKIKPMITLYNFDLPQKLQKMGGWTNPLIVDWFSDYARTVFRLFGDRVKTWITISEPHVICYNGYGENTTAPRLRIKGIAEYLCAKNLLLAHAKTYHIYHEEFKPSIGGEIGIAIDADNYEAATEDDIEAADETHWFTWEQYAHPIFSRKGDFPAVLKNRIASKSIEQGYPRSRLPRLSREEVEYIRGSSDFFGLDHYHTYLVFRNDTLVGSQEAPSILDDLGVETYHLPEWTIGASNFTKYVPWGFTNLLLRIKDHYNNPKIYVMKNGFATFGGLEDDDRVTYFRGYLDAILHAIEEGCDVRAYAAYSLMDNFEWMEGYTERFGLYEVNYMDPTRPRTPRKSAFLYKRILRTRTLDFEYDPDHNYMMTIDQGH